MCTRACNALCSDSASTSPIASFLCFFLGRIFFKSRLKEYLQRFDGRKQRRLSHTDRHARMAPQKPKDTHTHTVYELLGKYWQTATLTSVKKNKTKKTDTFSHYTTALHWAKELVWQPSVVWLLFHRLVLSRSILVLLQLLQWLKDLLLPL